MPSPYYIVAFAALVSLGASYLAWCELSHEYTVWNHLMDVPWSDTAEWRASLTVIQRSSQYVHALIIITVVAATGTTLLSCTLARGGPWRPATK